ncbi:hypothetical protein EGM51_03110 [Verrucomicrobia bacterium S94]|nr:hypothetical protein EGM51_03110 [Verrucomicrobia bacterium S94]
MEVFGVIIAVVAIAIALINYTPLGEAFISLLETFGLKVGKKYGLKELVETPESKSNEFINKTGITKSPLKPSGIALFDGKRVHVISSDKFIEPEIEIIVDRVKGNRIYVKQK